ncbi:hypothetical protein CROQUDRAFT_9746, partial [Cronartium quercuum f. sp. fusiforme G11]
LNRFSDDTPINKNKRWNKHMRYYLKFASLPPTLTNLHYNIHRLTVSNVANAMELAENI